MRETPDNELFSAYLDGEVSAGEKARVEQLLATDPAARQLMDELRAVSSAVRSLPPFRLDESLTEAVLRGAERRVLAEGADSEDGRPLPLPIGWADLLGRFLQPRVLLWTAVVMLVGLALYWQEHRARTGPAWHPPGDLTAHAPQVVNEPAPAPSMRSSEPREQIAQGREPPAKTADAPENRTPTEPAPATTPPADALSGGPSEPPAAPAVMAASPSPAPKADRPDAVVVAESPKADAAEKPAARSGEKVLLIEVALLSKTADDRAFEDLLKRQLCSQDADGLRTRDLGDSAAEKPSSRDGPEANDAPAVARVEQPSPEEPNVERVAFEVEATSKQILAVVGALAADPKDFRIISRDARVEEFAKKAGAAKKAPRRQATEAQTVVRDPAGAATVSAGAPPPRSPGGSMKIPSSSSGNPVTIQFQLPSARSGAEDQARSGSHEPPDASDASSDEPSGGTADRKKAAAKTYRVRFVLRPKDKSAARPDDRESAPSADDASK